MRRIHSRKTTTHRESSWNNGFTLIELLVVLAISGILLVATLPSMVEFYVRNKLSTLANELVGAFSFARTEAVTRNKRVTICARARESTRKMPKCTTVGDAWQLGWIVYVDDGATIYKIDASEKILRYRDQSDERYPIHNNCAGNPLRHLSYNSGGQPRGSFTGADLVILADQSDTEKHLCLARGGRVRVQDQYCSQPRPC